ncbi:YccF domain-containing protein [Ancylomarina longa]|uniref:YccF domain-containing protein n=1 Tax=Ancylomarina longa TaxID=2487017 RepID=A0A434AWQ9_9BACT|nr:YccF domain-containing protein [Ancylomarina longa]RUT78840.1 YccF domain-containing protein [Ancylomarina longa]
MSIIGNIIWIVFGGFFIFLEYIISGILMCCTIVGIPFGVKIIQLSILGLAPFGQKVEYNEHRGGCLSIFLNVIWIFIGGIWIALSHLLLALLFAITIIGIPFATQHIKLAGFALTPFGKSIR